MCFTKFRYHGHKLHAVCSVNGVFQSFDLSLASVYDFHYLKDIQTQIIGWTLITDKGYLSSEFQLNLFETCNKTLNTVTRNNQKKTQETSLYFRKNVKEFKHYFLNFVTNLWLEEILQNHLNNLKLEHYTKSQQQLYYSLSI